MSEEAIFVAIGIACVVAVLLFIVFIIYCVKKQQDKEQDRQMRHRRAREERHRRHLMRANIVRPPPYDPDRLNVVPITQAVIPVTPPPEYKEVATPLPTNRNHTGPGDTAYTSYNGHSSQPASTGNSTPMLVGASYNNNNLYTTGNSSDNASNNNNNNNRNYINRNAMTTTRNGHISNKTSQVQPHIVATDNRELMSRSSNSSSINADYSFDRNRQVPSVNVGQRNQHTATTQQLSAVALMRQQNANIKVPVNTVSSAKPGESSLHNSYSRNADHQKSSSNGYHNYNSFVGAGSNSNQTERKTAGEIQTVMSNSSRYSPAGVTSAAQTARTLLDVNIVTVTPVEIPNRGIQSRDSSTRRNADHARKSDRTSGLEELSLI